MTPSERDMIQSVFDRLAKLAGGPKDAQAEALIHERLRSVPDAAYNLVEAVVVQEMAIKESEARIRDLEAQLAARVQQAPQQQPGGFGRSAWGGGRGSVPSTQAPQQQVQQQQYAQQPQPSPWGGQPSAGGSFLRTAAGAAVGVAGGMLLANSISSMFAGGHGGGAHGAQQASDTSGHAPAETAPPSYDTNVADDQGYSDYDSGSGFDMGGDEF